MITAMAIGAHPDDIEFNMAGTLLLLKEAGAEIHMWNLANGSCGSERHTREEIIRLRKAEVEASAHEAGATLHPALVDDLCIFYDAKLIAEVAAVIRQVKPDILLVPSPQDYMEDHVNTGRLAVTGAFARGMSNFETIPPVEPWNEPVAIYHAEPAGLCDNFGQVVWPERYVNIESVFDQKRRMLAKHATQKDWLDESQGMDSYLLEMEMKCKEMGRMSQRFSLAEGWRRHYHLGFSLPDFDPLVSLLGSYCADDPAYPRH